MYLAHRPPVGLDFMVQGLADVTGRGLGFDLHLLVGTGKSRLLFAIFFLYSHELCLCIFHEVLKFELHIGLNEFTTMAQLFRVRTDLAPVFVC